MFELYMQGDFGNMWPTWYYPDFIKLNEKDFDDISLSLRYNDKPGTQLPFYAIPLTYFMTVQTALEWVTLGCKPNDIIVNINENRKIKKPVRTMQGEVMECDVVPGDTYYSMKPGHYSMLYTQVDENMRPALLKNSRNVSGAVADLLLSRYMDAPSRDNLRRLLYEDYQDNIVEFTCYNRGVGVLGWNTVFWEVRHY